MLTSRHKKKQAGSQTDNVRQAGRQAAKQAGGGRHQAYRQSGWKNSRQADRPAGRQEQTMSGRQASR